MASLTLDDLLPGDWGAAEVGVFEPCASYSEPMDLILYLREDEAYRADRIDQFLTILWHPHDDRVIGFKLKGIRFLFESLRDVVAEVTGADYLKDRFLPLVGALNLALKMNAGAGWADHLQAHRAEDFKRLEESYDMARGIAQGVAFDLHDNKVVA